MTLPVLSPDGSSLVSDIFAVTASDAVQALATVHSAMFLFVSDQTGDGWRHLDGTARPLDEEAMRDLGLRAGGMMRLGRRLGGA